MNTRFWRLMINALCILSGLLMAASVVYAQQAASTGNLTTMSDGPSWQLVAWLVSVAAVLIAGAGAINMAIAKINQQISDHVSDTNIHPTRQELDAVYVRKEICDIQHKSK